MMSKDVRNGSNLEKNIYVMFVGFDIEALFLIQHGLHWALHKHKNTVDRYKTKPNSLDKFQSWIRTPNFTELCKWRGIKTTQAGGHYIPVICSLWTHNVLT
jgi:hypothetical protein